MIDYKIKDHSVSGELFSLEKDLTYGFLKTVPQPSETDLPKYYNSEDYISHTNAKRSLFENIYHTIRKITLKQKLGFISPFVVHEKSLLDYGCGTGHFLSTAKQSDWVSFGVEPNENARKTANENIQIAYESIDNLPKKSFSIITLWHVLEHLPNLDKHITLFKQYLKDDGALVIAVPNYKSYDAAHYKTHWAAYDVPRHLWHFDKKSIHSLFKSHGMSVVKTKRMWFDAFYVSLLSETYKSGKMNIIKGFLIGLWSNIKALKTKETSSLIYVIKKNPII